MLIYNKIRKFHNKKYHKKRVRTIVDRLYMHMPIEARAHMHSQKYSSTRAETKKQTNPHRHTTIDTRTHTRT